MPLAITSYTPTTGSVSGGTVCVITGTGLDNVDAVFVGNVQATIITNTVTPTSLAFRTPAQGAGAKAVSVIDHGTSTEVQAATPFTYSAAAAAEKLVSTLARKWKLDVDVSVAQDGSAWIPVRAITDFQPANPSTMQDDTDYDGDGYNSQTKTGLGWNNVVKLARKKGLASSAYDAGQEALRDRQDEFGADGIAHVRWYDRNGSDEAYEGFANVEWVEDGGNATALSGVTCTLSGVGKREKIANPAA